MAAGACCLLRSAWLLGQVLVAVAAQDEAEEVCAAEGSSSSTPCRRQGAEGGAGVDEDAAGSEGSSAGAYFWPRRAGNGKSSAFSVHVGPNLTAGPAWQWDNENDEELRHAAQIDEKGNVYLVTSQGWARKFSPDGVLVWSWRTKEHVGKVHVGPTLYRGSIYFISTGSNYSHEHNIWVGGYAFCLDMQTGIINWRAKLPNELANHDSATATVYDGVIMTAMRDWKEQPSFEGHNKVVALSTEDGGFLWDYRIDGVVWNFMPSLPGDGSVLFASNCGVAHRLGLKDGRLIWKAALKETGDWCGTGGGALGPNGRFYVAANYFGRPFDDMATCVEGHCPEGPGLFLAYNVSDGAILLRKRVPMFMNQYPAVGPILGNVSRLQVVVGLGVNPHIVPSIFKILHRHTPEFMKRWWYLSKFLFWAQYRFAWVRRLLDVPGFPINVVAAVDAETGEELWHFEEEPWDHYAAAGDEEGFYRREAKNQKDWREEVVCAPDSWGIPVIGGDGTIYAGSGISGKLYSFKDANGDGKVEAGEVSVFDAGNGFINGPALGPGMLVAAACFGPMYVFKDPQSGAGSVAA